MFGIDVAMPVQQVVSSELRSCVKVEEDVLGSPSLKVLMVSLDVK